VTASWPGGRAYRIRFIACNRGGLTAARLTFRLFSKRSTAALTPRLARRDDMGPCVSACPAQHQAHRCSCTHPAVTALHSVRIPRGSFLRCRRWVGARVPSGCRSPDTPQILAPSRTHGDALPAFLPTRRSSSHGSGVPNPVRARRAPGRASVRAASRANAGSPLPPHPLALLCAGALAAHAGSAADIRGALANGWQRPPISGTGSQVALESVYAGDAGFLALGGFEGWPIDRIWMSGTCPAPLCP
jgi:hypothetical protein